MKTLKMHFVLRFLNYNRPTMQLTDHTFFLDLKGAKRSWIFFLMAAFLIAVSCQSNQKEESQDCQIKKQVYEISIPPATSVGYRVMDTDVRSGVLVGYHYRQHALDWIDLDNGRFIKHQKLPKSGPNRVEQVLSLTLAGLDTVFLQTTQSIIRINGKGDILAKKLINRYDSALMRLDFKKYKIWCAPEHNIPLYFSARDRTLYVGVKSQYQRGSPEYYSSRFCGRINLDDWSFEFLDIDFPAMFQQEYFGSLDQPQVLFFDDFAIYGFQCFYDLFAYDYGSGASRPYNFSSEFLDEQAKPLINVSPAAAARDPQIIINHFNDNSKSIKIRANRSRNEIYKMYSGPKPTDSPSLHAVSIFEVDVNTQNLTKKTELVRPPEASFSVRSFFATSRGLGLFDKSTDDVLRLSVISCDSDPGAPKDPGAER